MPYSVQELKHICLYPPDGVFEYPAEDMNEVFPGIFLGNASSAHDIDRLKHLNIAYVLNACHGNDLSLSLVQVHSKSDYEEHGIAYLGIPSLDLTSYPLHRHFGESTDFIRIALQSGKKVLVHCKMGISRSATLVVAYLMEAERMNCMEALKVVRSKRVILPNDGFLMQLAQFTPCRCGSDTQGSVAKDTA